MATTTPTLADAASGRLTVDLDAIAGNWRSLYARAAPAEVGAVVKADAYGLGHERVAPALWSAGARRFYVAQTEEGVALRAVLPNAVIVILSPTFPESFDRARRHRLTLSINGDADLAAWRRDAAAAGSAVPALFHIDTGMTRLGFDDRAAAGVWAALRPAEQDAFVELATHLACADLPDHPINQSQLDRFRAAAAAFPERLPRSVANSSGMFLGGDFLQDVARPGMALYGLNPTPGRANPMRRAVTLEARVLQTRRLARPETVGYGATVTAPAGARLATVAAGYADGLHRALAEAGSVFIAGRQAPMLGRVSMDMIVVDISGIPEDLCAAGDFVEMIGPNQSADDLADAAGTIGYELLTGLGRRYRRVYAGGPV